MFVKTLITTKAINDQDYKNSAIALWRFFVIDADERAFCHCVWILASCPVGSRCLPSCIRLLQPDFNR